MADIANASPLAAEPARTKVSPMVWLVVSALPILLFLLVPILMVIPLAFTKGQILMFPPNLFSVGPFRDLFSDSAWMSSVAVSIKIGIVATAISVVVGVSCALALNSCRKIVKGVVTGIVLLPVMIPGIVMALGFYLFFRSAGLGGSWFAIALAHSVAITPFVFVATQASMSGIDPMLPRAARSLGAGSFSVLMSVYWPTIRPGVIGGAIFAFIGSFDEIVISLFLAGPNVVTLPVQIFTSLQTDLTPKVAAVSVMLFLLSLLGLGAQAYQYRLKNRKPPAVSE